MPESSKSTLFSNPLHGLISKPGLIHLWNPFKLRLQDIPCFDSQLSQGNRTLITALLKSRVSVRRFQHKPIPDTVIQEMLEAARLSPPGGNQQPWGRCPRGGRDIQMHRYPKYAQAIASISQKLYWALNQEEHQTKIPGTHIVLAALEHGVGSCWMSRFDVEGLAKILNLPQNYLPSEILVFGYPGFQQEPRSKKSLNELTFRNVFKGWGNPSL